MAEKFQIWWKLKTQRYKKLHKLQEVNMYTLTTIWKHIIVKFPQTSNQEKTKAAAVVGDSFHTMEKRRTTAVFLSETRQARDKGMISLKCWKEKNTRVNQEFYI